ncbi:MAG: hypothetical protein QM737_18675 [Ferruginibacter sp.]
MKKIVSIFSILTFAFFISPGQSKKDSLFVFVGKKIEVTEFKPKLDSNEISFNSSFTAKYQILQNVYGDYKKDTIEFVAYDHYGIPAFSKYEYVLLFVSVYHGKLYHEKYQYFDVYKTKNGRWASGYQVGDYEHDLNKNTTVKPELIDFDHEVSYSVKGKGDKEIKMRYPSPYYKIENDRAIVVWGNYVEQLFELKKGGILKARGIFN